MRSLKKNTIWNIILFHEGYFIVFATYNNNKPIYLQSLLWFLTLPSPLTAMQENMSTNLQEFTKWNFHCWDVFSAISSSGLCRGKQQSF